MQIVLWLVSTILVSVVVPNALAEKTNEISSRMTGDGLEPAAGTPEEFLQIMFLQIIRRDVAKWKKVVKKAKIELAD